MHADDYLEVARIRVTRSPRLAAHADTIMHDWPEGDAHWYWVATAPADEIIDWAETIEAGEEQEDPLLSTGQVAQLLGVDRRTVTGWCESGRLAASRTTGGHWRIRESSLGTL